jgi:hypothetical protein
MLILFFLPFSQIFTFQGSFPASVGASIQRLTKRVQIYREKDFFDARIQR